MTQNLPGCMDGPSEPCEAFAEIVERNRILEEAVRWLIHGHNVMISTGHPGGGPFKRHLEDKLFALRRLVR